MLHHHDRIGTGGEGSASHNLDCGVVPHGLARPDFTSANLPKVSQRAAACDRRRPYRKSIARRAIECRLIPIRRHCLSQHAPYAIQQCELLRWQRHKRP
jgi:hypothetical protein